MNLFQTYNRSLLAGCLLLFSTLLSAQTVTFNFDNIPYSEIGGNYLILNDEFDDTTFFDVPIGFTYRFANRSCTTVNVSSNGELFFASDPQHADTVCHIYPFAADLFGDVYHHVPSISYQTGGCAGALVMKIQFKDCSFKHGNEGDYTNFQVWLYESTGAFEFHYGPGNVSNLPVCFSGETGPMVGTRCSSNSGYFDSFLLYGFPFAPEASTSTINTYLDGVPEEGQSYYIEYLSTTGLTEVPTSRAIPFVSKDASGEILFLHEYSTVDKKVSLALYDLSGTEIRKMPCTLNGSGHQVINIPIKGLPAGIWFLSEVPGDPRQTFRFFIP